MYVNIYISIFQFAFIIIFWFFFFFFFFVNHRDLLMQIVIFVLIFCTIFTLIWFWQLIRKYMLQSNLYKMTTLGTTKWSSWTSGRLTKHLYQTTTNKIWLFLTGFYFLFLLWRFYKQWKFAGIKIYNFVCSGAILED